MRRMLLLPLFLLPLTAHASDSTDYARSTLSCKSQDPTGCHPDYRISSTYTLGNAFPEMGWIHIELTMPNEDSYGKSTLKLLNPDGTTAQTWTHEGRNVDTFMIWAPVHSGQKLTFSGNYREIFKSVFHPCIKLK